MVEPEELMKIVIVDPYLTGSHAAWAAEYAEHSLHDVEVLGLKGRHWKWRMHGGAVTLARLFCERHYKPDLILASDMLDLTTFLALTRQRTAGTKTGLYFHENQITYPWSGGDPDPAGERDVHYGFINFTSALAADFIAFNSSYHMQSFLDALQPFLHAFPDYNEESAAAAIAAKSHVLHLGTDLRRLDKYSIEAKPDQKPLILWNHRWEYDKNPEDFFRALFVLAEAGLEFEVAVLGERFAEVPRIFSEAASRLGDRIVQFGFVDDFPGYASWLWKADIIPVTSIHDFFGVSVVQAIYCNTYPLLPDRLAYPEHLGLGPDTRSVEYLSERGGGLQADQSPAERRRNHVYESFDDLVQMLTHCIQHIGQTRQIKTQGLVRHYDWETMAPKYDRFFESGSELTNLICNNLG
jgi:glycosyltransferase involved in cell wall biosynthesis